MRASLIEEIRELVNKFPNGYEGDQPPKASQLSSTVFGPTGEPVEAMLKLKVSFSCSDLGPDMDLIAIIVVVPDT